VVQSDDWFHLATLSPVIDTLPSTRRRLNTQKTGCAIKVSQCSGHLYWIKLVLTGSMKGQIFWWSQSGLLPLPWAQKVCIHGVISNMARTLTCHHYELWNLFPGAEETLVLRRAYSAGEKVFRFRQSAPCTTAVGSKSVLTVWFTINGQNIDLPSWQNGFSRCWGAFWSLVEHLPQVEKCSGPVIQYCVSL